VIVVALGVHAGSGADVGYEDEVAQGCGVPTQDAGNNCEGLGAVAGSVAC
jgi:hypothetical protein